MKKTKTKLGAIDFTLFVTIALLVSIGVIMVYSASSYSAFFNPNVKDSTFFLKKQGGAAIVGIIAMLFTIKIDYHKIKNIQKVNAYNYSFITYGFSISTSKWS